MQHICGVYTDSIKSDVCCVAGDDFVVDIAAAAAVVVVVVADPGNRIDACIVYYNALPLLYI